MPATFDILEDGTFLHIVCSGVLWGRDMLVLLDALEGNASLPASYVELSDYSAVGTVDMSEDEITQMAHLTSGIYARTAAPRLLVFVLRSGPPREQVCAYVTGLRALQAGLNARTFDNEAAARAFLAGQDALPTALRT